MTLTTRVFEVAYQVSTLSTAPVPTKDYPVRCDVSNAIDTLLGFIIGNLKGLASPVAMVVLIACAVALIIVGGKSSSKIIRIIVFALAGLLLLTIAAPLVASFGSSTC